MEKKKKTSLTPYQVPKLPFLFLWSLPYALGWLSGFLLFQAGIIGDVSTIETAAALTLVLGWPVSVIQQRLLNHHTALNVTGWVRRSMVGWMIGGFLLMAAANFVRPMLSGSETVLVAGQVVAFFVMPALLQWTLLRKQVHNAWLWILGGAVSSAAFALPVASIISANTLAEWVAYVVGGATQGFVVGMVMIWLLTMLRTQAASQANASVNIQRLTMRDHTHNDTNYWFDDEDNNEEAKIL